MGTTALRLGKSLWTGTRNLAPAILPWTIWAAMTVAMILYVRQFTRNVPFADDIALVGMMTGKQAVNLEWLWAQHNEHRPVISRLILTGLTRYVQNDFRTGLYFNVVMLSVAAAMMLLLARRFRGSTSVTDSVLPLTILTIGQNDSLTIAYALNLILSAWISYELIAAVGLAGQWPGWSPALRFGLCLVLLPLCGGSGLVMLPPLALWLIGYVAWGWWSGREPGRAARAIGIGCLIVCAAIVALYLRGYLKPAYHPLAPSVAAAASTTLECLSMAVWSNVGNYWRLGGLLVATLSAVTLLRLVYVGVRASEERLRAFGLIAIILSLLSIAAAVGLSRSGLGPGAGLATRYITIMSPLPIALYFAWLFYVPIPARRWLHLGLLVLIGLSVPARTDFGLQSGGRHVAAERQVVRNLKARVPGSQLVNRACPAIFPNPDILYQQFKVLKDARFGPFAEFVDDRVAAAPETSAAVRR